jgi:hypothetical protein
VRRKKQEQITPHLCVLVAELGFDKRAAAVHPVFAGSRRLLGRHRVICARQLFAGDEVAVASLLLRVVSGGICVSSVALLPVWGAA